MKIEQIISDAAVKAVKALYGIEQLPERQFLKRRRKSSKEISRWWCSLFESLS